MTPRRTLQSPFGLNHSAPRHSLVGLTLLLTLVLSGCAGTGTAMKTSPTLAHVFGISDIPVAQLEKEYANEESEFMKLNGYQIHYRDQGSGEPVVLLHHTFGSLHTWEPWINRLSRQYRVISVDLPGFGLTGAPKNPEDFNRENLAATFAGFIDRLDLENFNLIGHSLGAEIAADYTALNSNRINRLVLISPSGYPRETGWRDGLLTSSWVTFFTNRIQSPILLGARLNKSYGDPDRLSKQDATRFVQLGQRPGAAATYTETRRFTRARAQSPEPRNYDRIATPTLLMWGEADRLNPPEQAQQWRADLNHVALVTYPEIGHLAMEEEPRATLEDALRFLDEGLTAFPQEAPEPQPVEDTDLETTG